MMEVGKALFRRVLRSAWTSAILLVVFALFAGLREFREFWFDSGGYPRWLRHLVGVGFYPLIPLNLAVLVIQTRLNGVEGGIARKRGMAIRWAVFAVALGYAGSNNFENLLHRRPLHWHRPVRAIGAGRPIDGQPIPRGG
jgi:hypothetical protein